MRRSRLLAVMAAGLAALTVSVAVPAQAHDPRGTANDPHMKKFTSADDANGDPTAFISYRRVIGGDAPGSPQPKALRMETAATSTGFAGTWVRNVGIRGRALGDVDRIAFKTRGPLGAGAPRLSVRLDSEGPANWLFLSAFHCHQDAAGPWQRALFTASRTADPTCEIYTGTGAHYVTDETSSAWEKLVEAEGADTIVKQVWLVQDEGPAVVWVDDIRLDGVLFAGPTVNVHSH
ncbi:MAG: hypothetical protein ACRDPK_08385 [Carbonactinosporaceae bacterium]